MQETQKTRVPFLGWEDPLGGRNGDLLQYILPGESHGQRSLTVYNPWGCKRVGHYLATKQVSNFNNNKFIETYFIRNTTVSTLSILNSCNLHNSMVWTLLSLLDFKLKKAEKG